MMTRERLRCDKCTDWVTNPARMRLRPTAPQESRGRANATPVRNLCTECYATAEALLLQWHALPHFVVHRYSMIRVSHSNYEEVLSDMHKVMWTCCIQFDPARGFLFSTYATNSMKLALRTFFKNVRKRGLTGNSEGKVEIGVTSLDADRGSGDNECSLADALADDGTNTAELLHQHEQRAMIEQVLRRIDKRYAYVLRSRHLGPASCTLDDVAKKLGVTRERVRQLELKAMERFRLVVEEMGGDRIVEAML